MQALLEYYKGMSNMAEKVIKALVDGGKASAGPPLGPTLAPMGVNITEVIKQCCQCDF